jgi:hypothetical protein
MNNDLRRCLREPIPQIFEAAVLLEKAVEAHLANDRSGAEQLLRAADMPVVREWTESIWGAGSPYVEVRSVAGSPKKLEKADRVPVRMPNAAEKQSLHDRDGYNCRFCGIPVIRKEIRSELKRLFPEAVQWGRRNIEQHASLQAMWLQYDHVLPHARGGDNEMSNVVITCAPCNFGRMDNLVEEVGLLDPRSRPPAPSDWDGLERLLQKPR